VLLDDPHYPEKKNALAGSGGKEGGGLWLVLTVFEGRGLVFRGGGKSPSPEKKKSPRNHNGGRGKKETEGSPALREEGGEEPTVTVLFLYEGGKRIPHIFAGGKAKIKFWRRRPGASEERGMCSADNRKREKERKAAVTQSGGKGGRDSGTNFSILHVRKKEEMPFTARGKRTSLTYAKNFAVKRKSAWHTVRSQRLRQRKE